MCWRSCLCVIGPFFLRLAHFLYKRQLRRRAWFWDVRRLRCQSALPKAAFSTDTCPGRWATRPRATIGGMPCSQNLPKYRSRALGQCGTSLVPGATPGRSQCISRMPPEVPENVAHKASPMADRQSMRQASQHSMDCVGPAMSAASSRQRLGVARPMDPLP